MKRTIIGAALSLALAMPAFAQSNPGFIQGQVPSPAQWNSYFSSKFNYGGGLLGGPLGLPAATTSLASLNIAPGATPTTPNNGDMWIDSAGLEVQIAGATIGPLGSGGGGGGGGSGGGGGLVWQPSGNYSSIPAVNTSGASRTLLPAGAPTFVVVSNYGANSAAVVLGNSGTTIGAFASGGDVIPPGGYIVLPTGSNTNLTAISLTGTTSIQISGGVFVNQPQNVAQWAGTALTPPTAWGVAPTGSPIVPNVNANIVAGSIPLAGFQPTPSYQTLAVGASSNRTLLPTGLVVVVYNTGANNASVTLGGTGIIATTTNDVVVAGCWTAFTVGSNTDLAAIQVGGSTSLTLSGGSGLPTGSCAGGSGGGGSNASVGATGATAPASATYTGMLVSGGNMAGESGSIWGSAPTGLNVLGVNADVLTLPAVTQGTSNWTTNITQVAGTNLGAPSFYGTSPGAVAVPGVNAFVTNEITPFQSNGNYLNVASVTNTSTNSALPAGGGTNVVLYNYGGYKIIYALSSSGASTVTTATADGVLQPGGTIEVAVGSKTNIAYATTTTGLTSSLQVVGGTGLWTGSTNNAVSVGQTGIAAPPFAQQIGGIDNSSLLQNLGVTPAGTSTTHEVLAFQGVTGGVPANVNCTAGCSGGTADATITGPTGTISAANNFSTGLQVSNWQNGRVTLAGTATTGSILSWSGFSGWNSGILACTGAGTQGVNWFEVDISGPTGGALVRRVATFTGPSASIPVNLAGQTFLNVVADAWTSGAPTCVLRGSVNQSVPDDYAVPIQANLTAPVSFNTAATVVVLPAVAGSEIYVGSGNFMAASTTNVTWEYGTQTTNPCDTGTTALTGAYPLTAQQGAPLTLSVPPGNQLCAVNSAAIQVSGFLSYARR